MKQYRYVVVSSQGASIDLSKGVAELPGLLQQMWYTSERYQELQDRLEQGWRPVREVGMGGGGAAGGAVVAFALVLLEREEAEPPTVEAVQP